MQLKTAAPFSKWYWMRLLLKQIVPPQNPAEEKFRKIKLSNAAFQSRIGTVTGGTDFLQVLGFESISDADGSQALFLPQDKATRDMLNAAGSELNSALTNPFFGLL